VERALLPAAFDFALVVALALAVVFALALALRTPILGAKKSKRVEQAF
jgi:hypothetical protein